MRALATVWCCLCCAVPLAANEPATAIAAGRQPRLVSDRNGRVYCVYGSNEDLYCARSDDGGTSFSKPTKIASLPGLMLGKRRGPRVATTGEVVVVSAISSADGNLVAWRSADGGRTWSQAVRINDADRSCREGLHDLSAAADGTLGSIWLDLRNPGTQLWTSFSRDAGITWSENQLAYRSPDGSVCPCCHPTIAAQGSGWLIFWRNDIGGHRDLYLARSTSAGDSFGDAVRLGDAEWTLDICPMDGGDLAVSDRGGGAVWRREKTCYASDLNNPSREQKLGQGEQPVVAVTSAGPAFAWIAARPGDLMFFAPGAESASKIASEASDPDLLSLPDGTVLCAYESVEDGRSIVRVSRWSPPR